jgi:hypothetical protein
VELNLPNAKELLPYKDTFFVFIHTNYRGGTLLTPDHWYVAEHILQFQEQFYLSIISLSGIYYPIAPFMMHAIIEIVDHLNQFENDSLLRDVIVPIKSKFLKYWLNIPLLYSFAFILYPRARLTGFNCALQVLSKLLNHDYSTYYNEVRTLSDIPPSDESVCSALATGARRTSLDLDQNTAAVTLFVEHHHLGSSSSFD